MLLGQSSEALGNTAQLSAVVGGDSAGDAGVPRGGELVELAERAHAGEPIGHLQATLGDAEFVEAVATVAIFNGLVRTADATGIPLDDTTIKATTNTRADLGINDYSGAANLPPEASAS